MISQVSEVSEEVEAAWAGAAKAAIAARLQPTTTAIRPLHVGHPAKRPRQRLAADRPGTEVDVIPSP
jgi:hypothetical protein